MTAESSHRGAFATSTTTSAPSSASASPSPVIALTPVSGDAASGSWPASFSFATSFDPMRPVPPMTTIFISSPFSRLLPSCPAWHAGPVPASRSELEASLHEPHEAGRADGRGDQPGRREPGERRAAAQQGEQREDGQDDPELHELDADVEDGERREQRPRPRPVDAERRCEP